MVLLKTISDEEFENLSGEKKKKYVASLLIERSNVDPVDEGSMPVAIVMAGLPGAGKTEFLESYEDNFFNKTKGLTFIRIDLDEIVTVFPGYTPKTDSLFRSKGNVTVSRCVDVISNSRYNMMIDGTFGGSSKVSINNIKRLLNSDYLVHMYFMHDNVETSWDYTVQRDKLTDRGIDMEAFKKSCSNVPANVRKAIEEFIHHDRFSIDLVLQKELRDKKYQLISDINHIDEILQKGYDIDKLG